MASHILTGRDFYNYLLSNRLRAHLFDLRSREDFARETLDSAHSLPVQITPSDEKLHYGQLLDDRLFSLAANDDRYLVFCFTEFTDRLLVIWLILQYYFLQKSLYPILLVYSVL